MKEHWELAEQRTDLRWTVYTWAPPWPAKLLGIKSAWPLRIREIVIGTTVIATDNHDLCRAYPSLEVEPLLYEVMDWKPWRPHVILVGQQLSVHLIKCPPVASTLELLIEPLEKPEVRIASRAQYKQYTHAEERALTRAAKRKRQVAECLTTLKLSLPVEGKRYR